MTTIERNHGASSAAGEISPVRQQATGSHWSNLWLAACILLAFAAHTYHLDSQSLWWDESMSLHRALLPFSENLRNIINLTDGVKTIATVDNHPQAYFVLLGSTARLLGDSVFALRYPSVIFSILIIPLLYVAGRRLMNESAGRYAALLGALSPMFLWYSQEARPYMMAAFMSLLSIYSLLRALDSDARHRKWIAAYVVATILMLFTHYLTFLILAVEIIIWLLTAIRSSRFVRWMMPMLVVLLVATATMLYLLTVVPPPNPAGGFSFIPLPILARDILNSFSLGLSVNVNDVIFLDLLFGLVAVFGLLAWTSSSRRSALSPAIILTLYFVIPFAATYAAGFVRPLYMNSRHLIIIAPAFFLAAGAGLAALQPRLRRLHRRHDSDHSRRDVLVAPVFRQSHLPEG